MRLVRREKLFIGLLRNKSLCLLKKVENNTTFERAPKRTSRGDSVLEETCRISRNITCFLFFGGEGREILGNFTSTLKH